MVSSPNSPRYLIEAPQRLREIFAGFGRTTLNREIHHRIDVVGIFPDHNALIRLVGAVLAEPNDEWIGGCRYLGIDVVPRRD